MIGQREKGKKTFKGGPNHAGGYNQSRRRRTRKNRRGPVDRVKLGHSLAQVERTIAAALAVDHLALVVVSWRLN